MSFDKNKHLREVLETHKMCHVQDFVDKVKNAGRRLRLKCTTNMAATNIHRFAPVVLLSIPPQM